MGFFPERKYNEKTDLIDSKAGSVRRTRFSRFTACEGGMRSGRPALQKNADEFIHETGAGSSGVMFDVISGLSIN